MIESLGFPVYKGERPFQPVQRGGGSLEDIQIIDLYWQRSESAIAASNEKYGAYCHAVANNILENHEDSEECVSDTWLHSWNAMPPQRPNRLAAFFAKITRNLAINRFNARSTEKRGGGRAQQAMDELGECLASSSDTEAEFSRAELERDVNRFLNTLPQRDCDIFMNRYFFVESTSVIAERYDIKESNVLLILSRTRKKLRGFLQKEGYVI